MHITYNKLWKLLIDKGMNKSDLTEITGISSRTMAKLSKNQSVTTDTLVNICSALKCDVSDIMQMVDDDPGCSLYEAYLASVDSSESNEIFTISRFEHKGRKVVVYKTIDKANRNTRVTCEADNVTWRQHYPLSYPSTIYSNYTDKKIFGMNMYEPGVLTVIVISGKCQDIRGLDVGSFISSRRISDREQYVYLMSEPIFKLFEPVHEFQS